MADGELLQSGFMAFESDRLTKVAVKKKEGMKLVIQGTVFEEDFEHYYDSDVKELLLGLDGRSLADVDFREKVLKKAICLFGNKCNFSNWLMLQKESPCFTYLHSRFLADTLRHVLLGKERDMEPSTYLRLLTVKTDATQYVLSDRERDDLFAEIDDLIKSLSDVSIHTLLLEWTTTIEGFADLIKTMNVIFGRREVPGY